MPEATPIVDAVDILRLVGPRSFSLAKEYARGGMVLETDWTPADGVLRATVQGSSAPPFHCRIALIPTRGTFSRPVRSTCTCPVAADCKHVAAALIHNNTTALRERTPVPAAPVDDAEPSWKSSIGALAGPTTTKPSATTLMGLQFELRERVRASRGRWEPPQSRTAKPLPSDSARTGDATYRLAVRPVLLSRTGNWVRGNLTWTSLPYQMNRLEIGVEQHRWFSQFAALHRSVQEAYTPGEADWLLLDDFASPLLWPLLEEGQRLGVAWVTGKKETDVTLGQRGRIRVDVRGAGGADQPDKTGPLELSAGVVIDDEAYQAASIGVIGSHGFYVFGFDPKPRFLLAPAASPVTEEQRQLLATAAQGTSARIAPAGDALRSPDADTGPAAIVIPSGDADEFLRDFYPRLQATVDVVSGDDSVTFPEIQPPHLVLGATFGTGDSLTLEWSWESFGTREPLVSREVPDEVVSGLAGLLGDTPRNGVRRGIEAAEFAATVLPRLEELGHVQVEISGERPAYRELTEAPHLVVTTVETDKRDWFDLGVLITVEGKTIPFGPLFKALSRRQTKLLLVDKSYLSLEHPSFDELRRLIEEARDLDEWDAGLRINRYQASLWQELEDLADETVQAETWRSTVGGLLAIETVENTPVPAGVDATLRPYQADGFSWLAFLFEHKLGGVLADDMGLGKTLQTLALFEHARTLPADEGTSASRKPFLVVAPTSVVSNWVAEAKRFTPDLVVKGINATQAKSAQGRSVESLHDLVATADVIVTSYALFRLDFAEYQAEEWSGLILDEAQFVKNRGSRAHRCAAELTTPFKLAITGTPMENNLMDLWSLFHIVAPGLLSTGTRFTDDYVKPITLGKRPDLLQNLRRRIRPLMMRRTKELVASELPAKQEQILRIDLTPEHRDIYDIHLQRERQKLLGLLDDELDRSKLIVFRSLTLLRLLSLDASLVDEAYTGVPSAKLDVLLDELDDVIAEGHRALIFSQFTSFLTKVAERLDERGVAHEYLDGSTTHRAEVIDRFKTGTAPAFLISLKAGGFGLNLTEADYVFLLDPWWNPATEAQAVDRTHRIGQTKNVMVYRMIANDTIEEKVLKLKEQKAQLFDAVMDDDEAAFSASLTSDDIRALLEG